MFNWITSSIGRHKKVLGVGALSVTAVIGAGMVCKHKLAQYQTHQLDQYLYRGQLENHALRHTQTCLASLQEYFVSLLPHINTVCDTDQLICDIKDRAISKKTGWDSLKSLSVTKIFTTLYSSTMLTMLVSVQLSVVSAALCKPCDPEKSQVTHSKYLYLITEVIERISVRMREICEDCVKEELMDVGLTQSMDYFTANEILASVNDLVLDKIVDVKLNSLCGIPTGDDDADVNILLAQTEDIITSSDFSYVFTELIQRNMLFIREMLYHNLSDRDSIVVAKLIPILTKFSGRLLDESKVEYLEHGLGFKLLKQFQSNVYEGLTS